MIPKFTIAATPFLHFGAGKRSVLPSLLTKYGNKVLLVTGAHSFFNSTYADDLMLQFRTHKLDVQLYKINREPTPQMIDKCVREFQDFKPDVVVAIGGGSVLDAGKAISAMVPIGEPVKNYLEGVGDRSHPGIKVPFIAVPTTSGTGSEATKNAVLSETGEHGFKKSLRHDNFVPDIAVIDPELTIPCPASITAASGMDAFTQLLESYLSTNANPVTDALALEGLRCVSRSLRKAYQIGSDLDARTDMALASYLSGITLANAGLGLVHGFASSIGAYFEIAHGVICSSLMFPANSITIRKLKSSGDNIALSKYIQAGKVFYPTEKPGHYYLDFMLDLIAQWTSEMKIPSLSRCGVTSEDFERIVSITDNKNNPTSLNKEEMMEVLEMAL